MGLFHIDGGRSLHRRNRDLRCRALNPPVEMLVEPDYRLEGGANLGDLGRHLRDPVGRRNDDRADREHRQRKEDDHAQARGELGRDSPALKPFEQRHQCDRNHQSGGYRHKEFGAGAESERHHHDQADAGKQGQRRQQPIALDIDPLGQRNNLLVRFSWMRMRCFAVHRPEHIKLCDGG